MALPKKFKHLNVFVDSSHWIGEAEDFTPAKLTRKTEAYRGSGMPGAVETDQGLADDALHTSFTFGGFSEELVKRMGTPKIDGVSVRFAGSFQRDDTEEVASVEIICRGRFKETDLGTLKQGDNSQTKITMACTYYKVVIDGAVLHEIDLLNMIEIGPDGVDRMAAHRKAIGL